MDFVEYVRRCSLANTEVGDFLLDASADAQLPRAMKWLELRDYLDRRNAAPRAMEAARIVWRRYLRAKA